MNKRKHGSKYEEIAAAHLERAGCTILERNFRCKIGEIDIVAMDGDSLVFVEVKYRNSSASGYPEEAVSLYKQQKISRTADYYCMKNRISDLSPKRFDVIAIEQGR